VALFEERLGSCAAQTVRAARDEDDCHCHSRSIPASAPASKPQGECNMFD